LAATIYVRAVGLPFALFAVGLVLWRRRDRHGLVLAAVLAVALLPWYVRNTVRCSYPHFSSVAAVNMYRYNACRLLAETNGRSFSEQQRLIDAELDALDTQQQIARRCAKQGTNAICKTPVRYAGMHLKADINTLFPASGELVRAFGVTVGAGGTMNVIHTRGIIAGLRHYLDGNTHLLWVFLPDVCLTGTLYVLAVVGWATRLRDRKLTVVDLLFTAAVIYFLLVPGPAAHPRFRVPVAPLRLL